MGYETCSHANEIFAQPERFFMSWLTADPTSPKAS